MEENNNTQPEQNKPKHRDKLEALDNMSLGISIVVAIALGVGLGLLLKSWTGYTWTLWLGVAYGIAAAVLNVKKAYDRQKRQLDKLADDPKYAHLKEHGFKDENDK